MEPGVNELFLPPSLATVNSVFFLCLSGGDNELSGDRIRVLFQQKKRSKRCGVYLNIIFRNHVAAILITFGHVLLLLTLRTGKRMPA